MSRLLGLATINTPTRQRTIILPRTPRGVGIVVKLQRSRFGHQLLPLQGVLQSTASTLMYLQDLVQILQFLRAIRASPRRRGAITRRILLRPGITWRLINPSLTSHLQMNAEGLLLLLPWWRRAPASPMLTMVAMVSEIMDQNRFLRHPIHLQVSNRPYFTH